MRHRAASFHASANWVFVLLAIAALWFGFLIIFTTIFGLWANSTGPARNPDAMEAFFTGSTPAAVRWSLATFGIYIAILSGLLRTMHRLGLAAIIGASRPTVRQFTRVSLYLAPLYTLLLVPSLMDPTPYQNMAVAAWLALLPATLPLLFVQISAEELVFRGYLQSHLAALARHPLVWMGIPSLLFGLIHYDPTSPTYSAWAYVAWATGLGLVCADLTARSGTLGPALAVHFINNIAVILIMSSDDWLYGAALYVWPTFGEPWVPSIPYESLFLLTVWLAARLGLRR